MHFTLKTNPIKRSDLDEFVARYNTDNRHNRKPTWSDDNPDGRWRGFSYEELLERDKLTLDIFWLRDESLEESDNLPAPGRDRSRNRRRPPRRPRTIRRNPVRPREMDPPRTD
jgi:type I restriction enzyme M protein